MNMDDATVLDWCTWFESTFPPGSIRLSEANFAGNSITEAGLALLTGAWRRSGHRIATPF